MNVPFYYYFFKVTQSCPTLCDPLYEPHVCMHVWTPCMNPIQSMEFSRPEYWSGYPFSSPGDLPNTGIEPRSPSFQADSLPAESQGKPKNTRVGSLSLLQWIFLL